MPQALKPLCFTQVGRIQFPHYQPSSLWGNNNWAPQYKDVKLGKFWEQNWLNRVQMVQRHLKNVHEGVEDDVKCMHRL